MCRLLSQEYELKTGIWLIRIKTMAQISSVMSIWRSYSGLFPPIWLMIFKPGKHDQFGWLFRLARFPWESLIVKFSWFSRISSVVNNEGWRQLSLSWVDGNTHVLLGYTILAKTSGKWADILILDTVGELLVTGAGAKLGARHRVFAARKTD